jgi:hypothetical protein
MNLIGPSYNLESRPASVQRTVNMVPVPLEAGNERTAFVFKDVPGLVSAVTEWSGEPPRCLDGPEWTASATTGLSGAHAGAEWIGSNFCLAGGVSGSVAVRYSTDGATWTNGTIPSITSSNIGRIVTSATAAVFECNAVRFARSTDGVTWSQITVTSRTGRTRPWYGNGRFWFPASSSGGVIDVSTDDGVAFSGLSVGFTASHGATNGTRVVAITAAGGAKYSDDNGTSWSDSSVPAEWTSLRRPLSVYWTGSSFVALRNSAVGGADDICYRSVDGATWATISMIGVQSWNDLLVDNGLLLAFSGNSAVIAISDDDGLTWAAAANAGVYNVLQAATDGEGNFAAIGVSTGQAQYGAC